MTYKSIEWAVGSEDSNFENLNYNKLRIENNKKIAVTIGMREVIQVNGMLVKSSDYIDIIYDDSYSSEYTQEDFCVMRYFLDEVTAGRTANAWVKVDCGDFCDYIFAFIDCSSNLEGVYFKVQDNNIERKIINRIYKKVDN